MVTGGELSAGAYAPASTLAALPDGFDAVLAKALAPDPAARWPSPGEFARTMKALLAAPH